LALGTQEVHLSQPDNALDGLPKDLTVLFFAAFSRFEYSLMRCDYLVPGQRLAKPDWHRLARELGDGFFDEVERCGKVPTLINRQARELVVGQGMANFGPDLPVVRNTSQLLKSAQRVRHNLFHGNKLLANDLRRDQQLMREVLWLLEFIMEKQPQIRTIFDEPRIVS
jgi:hypothetical protein